MQYYYDKKLLRDMKPALKYSQFGQKRQIPQNNGKTVQFRKFTPFAANTTELQEGVTPDGESLEITETTATIKSYGSYRTVSDMLDLTALDPVVNEVLGMQADQAALSVDNLVREVLTTSTEATNVIYAAGTARAAIAKTDVLTTVLLRKAVRALKKAKAPTIDGYYVAIVAPDTTFDLQADDNWIKVSQYQDKENIYTGEIGRIFGVRIVETTEAKFFTAATYILAAGTNINATASLKTIATDAYLVAGPSVQVTATATDLGSAGIAALANKYITVAGQRRKIASAAAAATPANGTVLTLDAALTGVADKSTDLNGITIYPDGGGKTGNPVAGTVVLGKNAYGLIDIEGKGAVKTYVKNAANSGTEDPLGQRNTIGWKIPAFTAKILMPLWMLRIEHGVSD
jgi:N4-gp56 family major capsid protein